MRMKSVGSQKLPQRLLDTLFENRAAGRPYKRLLTVVAAWFRFLELRADGRKIDDPLARELVDAIKRSENERQLVINLLATPQVFGGYPVEEISDELPGILQNFRPANISNALEGIKG